MSSKINEFDLDPSMDMAKQTTLQEVNTNVSGVKTDVSNVRTDVSGVKNDISSVKNDLATVKTKVEAANTLINNISANVAPLKRADDYLVKTASQTFNFLSTATRCNQDTGYVVLGDIQILADTCGIRVDCKYTHVGSNPGVLRFHAGTVDSAGNFSPMFSLESLSNIAAGTSKTYDKIYTNYGLGNSYAGQTFKLAMIVNTYGTPSSGADFDIQNVRCRIMGFKRTVTTELYIANSLKSYGYGDAAELNPAPRLDRTELWTQNDYYLYNYLVSQGCIRTVDGIPYIVKL